MLSGSHHRGELVSSAFCPQRNNLRTISPSSPAPCTSGAHQKMVDTVECSPLPTSRLTQSQLLTCESSSFGQRPHEQQMLLTLQHSHPDTSFSESSCQRHLSKSPNNTVHWTDVNKLQESNPLQLHLLTNNNLNGPSPVLHQSKTTPRPTAAVSASSTNSITVASGSKQYLNDDEIIQLIKKQLAVYRAQMMQESGSLVTNSLTPETKSSCSPQAPAPCSTAHRPLDGHISKDISKNEAPDCIGHNPEQSKMDNGTTTTKQPTEYVGIMQEAAAICSKKEGESQVVLQALGSCLTVDELVKQNPTLTQDCKPSDEVYKSTWRNVEPSDLRKSTPASSALETLDRETENTRDSRPQSSADNEDARTRLSQNFNLNTEFADKCSGRDRNLEMKHEQQESLRDVQTWVGKKGVLERMFDQLYENITDDEEANVTQQMPTQNTSLQNEDIGGDHLRVRPSGHLAHASSAESVSTSLVPKSSRSMLFGYNEDNERSITGHGSKQVATSRPSERNGFTNAKTKPAVTHSPKRKLVCVCPYFIQNDEDEMELQPCPKCVQDASLNQEEEGRSEDWKGSVLASGCSQRETVLDPEDDYIIVPLIALDVTLEEVIVISDDEDGSIEQPNQSEVAGFPKIQEFDTIFTFANQYNCKVPPEAISQCLSASCTLTKPDTVQKSVPEPVFEPASAFGIGAEDSCDTDDSSNYPSPAKRNFLTASNRARAPSALASSDSEDEPEMIMPRPPPESTSSINNFFPVLSADEDGDSIGEVNDTAVSSFSRETSSINCKESMKHCKKRTKRFKSCVNGDSDMYNQESNTRNSPDSGIASSQPHQLALKPGHSQQRPAQSGQNSSVSSKVSSQVNKKQAVEQKSLSKSYTSDHHRKDQEKQKSSSSTPRSVPQKRPDKSNGNTNASETRNIYFRQLTQPLPSQHISSRSTAVSSTRATLSLNGEKYHASSLPGSHTQGQPQTSSISKPKNQINSYSTAKSTPAKQSLVKRWEQDSVPNPPPRRRRRSSNDRVKTADGRGRKRRDGVQPSACQRNNSSETPLLKRSKFEAKELTKHAHRQPSTDLNPDNRFAGYKWGSRNTTASNDLDWERERESFEFPKGLTEY